MINEKTRHKIMFGCIKKKIIGLLSALTTKRFGESLSFSSLAFN